MSIFTGSPVVGISVEPSTANTPEEFKDIYSSMTSELANLSPGMTIMSQGFGIYSIAGYDTYAFVYRNAEYSTNPLKAIALISRIGYQQMTIIFTSDPKSFDQRMPVVQKMIDSIKITGR
jgi:hypothetical protein